jgi:LacI family transcriptional regulator, repressor for deo operon, udp, cdd, tsx, nupC, and nupG
MAASIEDVARRAGVSVATVSRALRGLPNVAPSTRRRVQEVAADLPYVPDPHASRLAARRSATIGLVVPMLGQWYYAQLFSGVEGAVVAAGYDVLPFVVGGEEIRQRFLAAMPWRKRVDGLIVADVSLGDDGFGLLIDSGVPIVTVGVRVDDVPSLGIDNRQAARAAVDHLLNLGHERVGLISSLPDDPFHFTAPVERERGAAEALEARGSKLDDALVVEGNFSFRGGAEAMARLLDAPDTPTAVFALSDEMAIGAMHVARSAGLDVPNDLSVVGFDDHDVSEYVGLTTVRQAVVQHGEQAVARLLERIASPLSPVTHDVPPTEVVVRASTGPPNQDERDEPGRSDSGRLDRKRLQG